MNGENYKMRSLMICTAHQILFAMIKSRRMGWAGHVARMGENRGYKGFGWENLKERDRLGDPGVDGRIILR